MFKHIVLFKFSDSRPETLAEVKRRLEALVDQIPELKTMEVGINEVESPRAYHLSLVATYDSLADMQAYQVHPAHQAFSAFITPIRESVVAVDYTA